MTLQAAGGPDDFLWATPGMVANLCDLTGGRVTVTDLVADGRAVPADFGAPGEPAPADRWVISMDSRGTLHGTGPAG